MRLILQILAAILRLTEFFISDARKQKQEKKEDEIHENPIDEFDDKFGRVSSDSADLPRSKSDLGLREDNE